MNQIFHKVPDEAVCGENSPGSRVEKAGVQNFGNMLKWSMNVRTCRMVG